MLTLAEIKAVTADHGEMTVRSMLASRIKPVARVRQRAMYLCRRLRPDCSLPLIGREFANRDHTTVRHAVNAVEARLADDPAEAEAVAAILRKLAPLSDIAFARDRVMAEAASLEARLAVLKSVLVQLDALSRLAKP